MEFSTILDVRTREEYRMGHVKDSLNIPLQEIPSHLEQIKSLPGPILLCCASGNRSGQATIFLRNMGIACENGGSWLTVNYFVQQREKV